MQTTLAQKTCEIATEGAPLVRHRSVIVANAQMFQMLSSKLYSDKPRAVLRELSTNAVDAHMAAGYPDKPIRVTLPSAMNPTLIVKDWGTGLPPEKMTDFYLNFGDSDKNLDNTSIGGFGVGCKSPFSYTDQFTAISTWNGTKYTFAVFTDEDGIPNIVEAGRESTDEHNGLEVQVPVLTSDIGAFTKAANRVFKYFDVQPDINIELETETREPTLTVTLDNGWVADLYGDSYDDAVILQGPIAYPVDPNKFLGEDTTRFNTHNSKEAREHYNFYSKPWVIRAPIGAVQLTPSREALSYDRATLAKLESVVKPFNDKIGQTVLDTIAEHTDLFEVTTALNQITHRLGVQQNLRWKGFLFEDRGFSVPIPDGIEVKKITYDPGGWRSNGKIVVHQHPTHNYFKLVNSGERTAYWMDRNRPFRQHFEGGQLGKNQTAYLFIGDELLVKHWLDMICITNVQDFPEYKAVKKAAGGTTRIAGATQYACTEINSLGSTSHRELTANSLLDLMPTHTVIISDLSRWSYELDRLTTFLSSLMANGGTTAGAIMLARVKPTHTRVKAALIKEGAVTLADLKGKTDFLNTAKIQKAAIAQFVYKTLNDNLQPIWQHVAEYIPTDKIVDPDLSDLLTKIGRAAEEAKNEDHSYLSYDGILDYDSILDDAAKVTVTKGLDPLFTASAQLQAKYQVPLTAFAGIDDAIYKYRYDNGPLQDIVVDWFNSHA